MRLLLISLLSCFAFNFSTAQAPPINWAKCYGGSYHEGGGGKIINTADGGSIFLGYCQSEDGDVVGWHPGFVSANERKGDIWVVKINSAGNIEWTKALGGSENDRGSDIIQTSDGGYLVIGSTQSIDGSVTVPVQGDFDLWLVKLSDIGDIEWQKTYGGTDFDSGTEVYQSISGDYHILGITRSNDGDVSGHHGLLSDLWFLKVDNLGNLVWQKCYGGTDWENWGSFKQTLDGGFIILGETYSNDGDVSGNHGQNDGWLLKVDALGTILWQKCIGGSSYDYLHEIEITSDGGFILCGNSGSNDGDLTVNYGLEDGIVIKTNSNGDIDWHKSYGGSSTDRIYELTVSSEGGYLLVGKTYSNNGDALGNHGDYDGWVFKIADNSDLEWQKCLGGSGQDEIISVAQTNDGSYMLLGSAETNDGDVIGNHSEYIDAWCIKLGNTSKLEELGLIEEIIFPNPSSQVINVTSLEFNFKNYIIKDEIGKIVQQGDFQNDFLINIESIENGCYFLILDSKVSVQFIKK